MAITLAAETATSEALRLLLNAAIPIGSLVIGWFLKVLSDSMSQKVLFDRRLRLEKEYVLYIDLWDKLFDLRRAIEVFIDHFGNKFDEQHKDDAKKLRSIFNAYQSAVRKGEPFMTPSVYDPAREIVDLARQIIYDIEKRDSIQKELNNRKIGASGFENQKEIDKLTTLEHSAQNASYNIEHRFQQVRKAIRERVTP